MYISSVFNSCPLYLQWPGHRLKSVKGLHPRSDKWRVGEFVPYCKPRYGAVGCCLLILIMSRLIVYQLNSLAKPRIQSQIWQSAVQIHRCHLTLMWKPLSPMQSMTIPQQSPCSRLCNLKQTLHQQIICRKGFRIDRSKKRRGKKGADGDLSSVGFAGAPLRVNGKLNNEVLN